MQAAIEHLNRHADFLRRAIASDEAQLDKITEREAQIRSQIDADRLRLADYEQALSVLGDAS